MVFTIDFRYLRVCYAEGMAAYISVTTDAFEERRQQAMEKRARLNVRRPLRGIQVKPDTYAVMRVLTADGRELPLFDSSAVVADNQTIGRNTYNANFIIQAVQEQRQEKQQIIETFGEDYVFFFGEQPRFLTFQGVLLNTSDFNWKNEFWANYEQYLRGTRLVEQNARLYLYYDDVVVEGYILNAGTAATSDSPHMLPFTFTMFVSNYAMLSNIGSIFIPSIDSGGPENEGLSAFTPEEERENAATAATIGGGGGLAGFITAASAFLSDASFGVQEVLENIKEFFYGRRIVVPEGLGSQVVVPQVENHRQFKAAPTNRPIHEMTDEYVQREGGDYNKGELDQVALMLAEADLSLQTPQALEAKARAELLKRGVRIEKPSEAMLLVGRGAFAAIQYTAPMALGRTGGVLGIVDQATSPILP